MHSQVSDERREHETPFQLMLSGDTEALRSHLLSLPRVRHMLRHRNGRRDLEAYWAAACGGELPADLGAKYLAVVDRQKEVSGVHSLPPAPPLPPRRIKAAAAPAPAPAPLSRMRSRRPQAIKEELRRELSVQEYDSRLKRAHEDALATLYAELGGFLCDVRDYDGSAAMIERALSIERVLFDNMSARVACTTRALARTRHLQGQYEDATSKLYLTLGIYRSLMASDSSAQIEAAQTLLELATVARFSRDPASAKVQCMSALRTFRRLLGRSHAKVALVLNSLAFPLCYQPRKMHAFTRCEHAFTGGSRAQQARAPVRRGGHR